MHSEQQHNNNVIIEESNERSNLDNTVRKNGDHTYNHSRGGGICEDVVLRDSIDLFELHLGTAHAHLQES